MIEKIFPCCNFNGVQPLVYDESLSYLEKLCVLQAKINECIEQSNDNTGNINAINKQLNSISADIADIIISEKNMYTAYPLSFGVNENNNIISYLDFIFEEVDINGIKECKFTTYTNPNNTTFYAFGKQYNEISGTTVTSENDNFYLYLYKNEDGIPFVDFQRNNSFVDENTMLIGCITIVNGECVSCFSVFPITTTYKFPNDILIVNNLSGYSIIDPREKSTENKLTQYIAEQHGLNTKFDNLISQNTTNISDLDKRERQDSQNIAGLTITATRHTNDINNNRNEINALQNITDNMQDDVNNLISRNDIIIKSYSGGRYLEYAFYMQQSSDGQQLFIGGNSVAIATLDPAHPVRVLNGMSEPRYLTSTDTILYIDVDNNYTVTQSSFINSTIPNNYIPLFYWDSEGNGRFYVDINFTPATGTTRIVKAGEIMYISKGVEAG